MTFFLFGGSIVNTFESEGVDGALKAIEQGADFQLVTFDPIQDSIITFLREVIGQDDFVVISEEEYTKIHKGI